MPEPWEGLRDAILATLEEGVSDFTSDLKDAARDFIKEQAEKIAKEKWRQLTASTDGERSIAEANIKHLQGQIKGEIARLNLAVTAHAEDLLKKVFDTVIAFVLRLAPALLA